MKKAHFIAIILPFLLLLPIAVFGAVETGGVDSVFSYGAGLRALGMGGAFTAMSHDPSLAYWNPGAMAFNQHKEVSFFGTRSIADSYYFSGFYTNPTISFGTLSVGAMGIYTGGIESYDENGSPITGVSDSYLHYQLLISYGYNFKFGLGAGATAKIEQMRITDYKGTGASFDLGVFYTPPKLSWLSFGAVVQDVYGTGLKLVNDFERPTRVYKAGVATNFILNEEKKTRLSFALDSRFYGDNYNPAGSSQLLYDFSIGSELSLADQIQLRAGYRGFTPEGMFQGLPGGLSLGFGFRRWGLGLDYAVTFEDSDWQGPVELLMRLGLSYRIGMSIDEKKAKEAEKIRQQIDSGIREATSGFENQLAQLEQQYTQEKEKVAQDKEQEYNEKLAALESMTDNQREKIAADLKAQYETDKAKSIDQLTQQYSRQRQEIETQLNRERATYNQKVTDLQRQFEQEKKTLKDKVTADEVFKSERYARGLQLFSDGEYAQALAEFEAVARFDPGYLKVQEYVGRAKAEQKDVSSYSPEILGIYYAGIDLFVQKKYVEAVKEWEKILKIDPYNKLALRNIKEAKQRQSQLKELGIRE